MEKSVGLEDNKIEPVTQTDSPESIGEGNAKNLFTRDEYQLAKLGYRQEFWRGLGLFENWAATYTSMNFASGIPVLFGFVMYTGGPTAAFANFVKGGFTLTFHLEHAALLPRLHATTLILYFWGTGTMVGGLSSIVSLSMAEIAASLPTAGGIYYWSYRLGGENWGPFLAWMTGWWNWAGWISVVPGVQQGSTNFLISALEVKYPGADVLTKGWFAWLLTSIGMFFAMAPNIINQRVLQWYFRFAVVIFHILIAMYFIWFPIKASRTGGFQPASGVFSHFYNGINTGDQQQASDAYCWIVSILFGAWVFFGYDTSVHLAEETQEAGEVVAKGMWLSTVSAWLMSVPTLTIILFCIQDFNGIIAGTYANNWAEYLVQLVGENGAVAILSLLWVDSTCATASCFMSAQRVTYAISRDGILPGSKYFRRLSKKSLMPINAAFLVLAMSIAITTAVIGSTVAFSAITATATIATNVSYLFPLLARRTKDLRAHEMEPGPFLHPLRYHHDGLDQFPGSGPFAATGVSCYGTNAELCADYDWWYHPY